MPSRRDTRACPAAEDAKREIERVLAAYSLHDESGKSFPLSDCLSVCPALVGGFSSLTSSRLSPEQRAFVAHAAQVAESFVAERGFPALVRLGDSIMLDLMARSRMDERVLGCLIGDRSLLPGKPAFRLTIQCSEPRQARVEIDGKARPAFQAAVPWNLKGFRWLECDGAALGLEGGRSYPVFLQSHALCQLRERLAPSLIPEVALQIGLICSLDEPAVAEARGDGFLIAFQYGGVRVGYLTARLVGDKLVVTTFLLLTMEGTPEGRLLRQKLRLSRRDIEYERLDRLETFLSPDVLADKELVKVLEASRCGSLLALARDGFPHTAVGGHAEELKRFLCIGEGAGRKPAGMFTPPQPRTA